MSRHNGLLPSPGGMWWLVALIWLFKSSCHLATDSKQKKITFSSSSNEKKVTHFWDAISCWNSVSYLARRGRMRLRGDSQLRQLHHPRFFSAPPFFRLPLFSSSPRAPLYWKVTKRTKCAIPRLCVYRPCGVGWPPWTNSERESEWERRMREKCGKDRQYSLPFFQSFFYCLKLPCWTTSIICSSLNNKIDNYAMMLIF